MRNEDLRVEDLRAEVADWLAANWDEDRPVRAWRNLLADSGWGCPQWPREWFGRGLAARQSAIVDEEFARLGAVGVATGAAMSLAAPTLLAHAADDLKARLLRPALTGEHHWCQLFSEPGNGSDLAGLTTRAERDGDEWVVSGQKVWNTGAVSADYGLLVARTDFDVPKHKGLTYFVIDMRQPAVEVRPLRQMNGYASFNEVFLTEARIPDAFRVGAVGEGWRVALTTLAHERTLPTVRQWRGPEGGRGRCREEAAEEAAAYFATYVWYPQRAGRADLAAPHARVSGRAGDRVSRDRVADLVALDQAARWTAQRVRAMRAAGREPGAEGSIGKLVGSEIARRAARVHGHLGGAHAMLAGPDAPLDGLVAEILVSVPGQSIAGGTDEIQRNILGERALGLPREPAVDVDIPFRQVRTNIGNSAADAG